MKNRALLVTAACGTAMSVAHVAWAQPYVVNTFGATLLQNALTAPALANDYIDVDLDGAHLRNVVPVTDRLTASIPGTNPGGASYNPGGYIIHQYTAIGSVNGIETLVRFGGRGPTPYATGAATLTANATVVGNPGFLNASQFLGAGGAPSGSASWLHTTAHPGYFPFQTSTAGGYVAIPWVNGTTNSGGGLQNNAAPVDVPTLWGVTNTAGDADPTDRPGQPGYGTNARLSADATGTTNTGNNSNRLVDLQFGLNLFDGTPGPVNGAGAEDNNTIFDTQIAWAPIVPIANFGTGIVQMDMIDIGHLLLTGRRITGENIHMVTREIGSGTHNAFVNSFGIDPSWGVGENIGPVGNNSNATDTPGAQWIPGNKLATGNVRITVQRHRLTLGYVGGDSWDAATRPAADIVAVRNDLNGRTGGNFIRPTIDRLLDNGLNTDIDPSTGQPTGTDGWRIGGKAIFATIGNPLLAPANRGGYAWSGLTPAQQAAETTVRSQFNAAADMDSVETAAFLNNISRSLADASTGAANGSPGQFILSRLIPLTATDYTQGNTGFTFGPGPLNQTAQDFARANANLVYNTLANNYANHGQQGGPGGTPGVNGKVSQRLVLSTGVYSDGSTGATYTTQSGGSVAVTADATDRNRIMGDANGDAKRDLNDAAGIVAAWRQRNFGPAWSAPTGTGPIAGAPGGDAIIEVLFDFSADGNFGRRWTGPASPTPADLANPANWAADTMDVRFWADGLALDPVSGKLDRKAGFTAVDNAWLAATGNANFFGTAKALGTYAAGDSRGDIANASGKATRGHLPIGADRNNNAADSDDNRIDAADADYVSLQINTAGDRDVDWAIASDAGRADLSADINGDLHINCADVTEIVTVVLGTDIRDVNLDGTVDAGDEAIVAANLGTANARWSQGDVNCDGVVDAADQGAFGGGCDSIDFNGDGLFPDNQDLEDFFNVFGGGPCSTGTCNDIDFNNDGLFPDNEDLEALIRVFGGGDCTL
ncbi:MAG TPA: dockerin type I domain-containing protein [Phycisphaerales bacterium]|nr:dockerin type I domain-containing protein [Phycisphaerales bacterium]